MAGGLISTFVEAFRKALGKPQIDTKELARSQGGSLGSTNKFRTVPQSKDGKGIDSGRPSVTSGDPEEGGEVQRR